MPCGLCLAEAESLGAGVLTAPEPGSRRSTGLRKRSESGVRSGGPGDSFSVFYILQISYLCDVEVEPVVLYDLVHCLST